MAFNLNDIYVTGGNSKIYNTWTPGVRKFDTNSFYNWEQDNVPLYDLEDRTYDLWERQGWPTSSVNGVVLTVSADASGHIVNNITGETILDKDPNIFLDVSSAIAALPEVIRFPIRVEICNFRNVGALELHNIKCIGRGALEIVNRPFAQLSMHKNDVSATSYDSSNVFVTDVSSLDLATMVSPAAGGISAIELSTTVFSSTTDHRYNGHSQIFVQHPSEVETVGGATLRRTSNMTVLFDVTRGTDGGGNFTGTVYTNPQETTANLDMSAITHPGTVGNSLSRASFVQNTAVVQQGVGFFYANYFTSLSIKNCTGPIYVRNIQVNGTDMSVTGAALEAYSTDVGIDILNSEVTLENCVAWRCNKAGIKISNSDVTLSRGCIAYRNYYRADRTSTSVSGGLAYGLQVENSEISLSAGPVAYRPLGGDFVLSFNTNQNGVYCNNSTIKGAEITVNTPSGVPSFQSFINDNTGIILENSNIDVGGRVEAWQNTDGVVSKNSNIDVNGLRVEYNQDLGMNLDNSKLVYGAKKKLRSVLATANKNYLTQGLENGTAVTDTAFGLTIDYPGQTHFAWNGQHLYTYQSRFTHPDAPWGGSAWTIGTSKFKMAIGRVDFTGDGALTATLPGIMLSTNSYAKFLQTNIFTEGIDTPYGDVGVFAVPASDYAVSAAGTSNPSYGSCISVERDSTAIFEGTGDGVTDLQGPVDLNDQIYNALAYACKGSTIKFSGPTLIMRGGIDVLAEDSSTMEFSPHTYKDTKFMDRAGFNLLSQPNHTKVDLHSSRACLVANRNSDIILKNLGSYASTWASVPADKSNPSWDGSLILSAADYSVADSSALTMGGHLQFYPNPNDISVLSDNPSGTEAKGSISDNVSLPLYASAPQDPVTGGGANASSFFQINNLTQGGVCLRAMTGSRVEIKNVNFPAGWGNCSSIIYDYNVEDNKGCSQTRIWNIDETSKLNASYLSVSGWYPTNAGYTGPSAVYVSGTASGTAYGCPSSTPHTNTLSVLDSFGTSGSVGAQNSGPFRIYFSPWGPAKWLMYRQMGMGGSSVDAGQIGLGASAGCASATGEVYQTLAQGYNPSGTCSAIVSSVSGFGSIYASGPTTPWYIFGPLASSALSGLSMPNGEDWYYTTDGSGSPTGGTQAQGDPRAPSFFYVKDMLPRDYYGRIRLDESAMNTFANAKNGTLGTSGRIRLVSFYSSTTYPWGESADSNRLFHGKGFRSANIFDLGRQN